MDTENTIQEKKARGPRAKPTSEKLVLVGAKVPPEVRAKIEDIALSGGSTISSLMRRACELLIEEHTQAA